jgi:hypothetical protein
MLARSNAVGGKRLCWVVQHRLPTYTPARRAYTLQTRRSCHALKKEHGASRRLPCASTGAAEPERPRVAPFNGTTAPDNPSGGRQGGPRWARPSPLGRRHRALHRLPAQRLVRPPTALRARRCPSHRAPPAGRTVAVCCFGRCQAPAASLAARAALRGLEGSRGSAGRGRPRSKASSFSDAGRGGRVRPLAEAERRRGDKDGDRQRESGRPDAPQRAAVIGARTQRHVRRPELAG